MLNIPMDTLMMQIEYKSFPVFVLFVAWVFICILGFNDLKDVYSYL